MNKNTKLFLIILIIFSLGIFFFAFEKILFGNADRCEHIADSVSGQDKNIFQKEFTGYDNYILILLSLTGLLLTSTVILYSATAKRKQIVNPPDTGVQDEKIHNETGLAFQLPENATGILPDTGCIPESVFFYSSSDGKHIKLVGNPYFWPLNSKGLPIPFSEWISEEDREKSDHFWTMFHQGKTGRINIVFTALIQGQHRYYELHVHRLPSAEKSNLNSIGMVLDITEQKKNEYKSQDTKLMFQNVLDNLPGYIFMKNVSEDYKYVLLNKNYVNLLGPDFHKYIGKTDYELYPPDADDLRGRDEKVIQGDTTYAGIELLTDFTGKRIYVKVFKQPFLKADGEKMLLGLAIDLTHEYELEQQLEKNVSELALHVEDEQSVNHALEFITSNSDFRECVHFFMKELAGKSDAERCTLFTFQEEQGIFTPMYDWVREGFPPLKEHNPLLAKDNLGDFFSFIKTHHFAAIEDTSNPPAELEIFAEYLRSMGIVSILLSGIWKEDTFLGFASLDYFSAKHIFTDADYRRVRNISNLYLLLLERENSFRKIEDTLSIQKQVFDNVAMPILLFDLDYNIISANPAACEQLGFSEKDVLGKKCYHEICKFGAPPESCPMRKTLHDGTNQQMEWEKNGRQYLVTAQPVRNYTGELVYILETFLDVSAQKEHANQLATKNLFLNRAADLGKITYFTGNESGDVKLIGGNGGIGLIIDEERAYHLVDWIIPEDRDLFEESRMALVSGEQDFVEFICRSNATKECRSYRIVVMKDKNIPNLYIGMLQYVTESIAMETKYRELVKTLNNYIENERVINICLSHIVMEDDSDKNIDEILEIIATHLKADRSSLGVFEEYGKRYKFSHEWRMPNIPSLKGIRDHRLNEQFLMWYERFKNNELVILTDITNSEYAETFKEVASQTIICAPVWVNRDLYGMLGLSFVHGTREISEIDENLLRSAAKIISLIKEHQIQEDALDALDRQNQIIFSTTPIPICLFNREGKLVRVNPAAAVMAGTAIEQMLKRPCYDTMCKAGSVPDYCPVHRVLLTGKTVSVDVIINGHECMVTATPIRDKNDEITHVLESAIDMTDVNEARKRLEIAVQAAQEANEAMGNFLATISHELRTPLNAVIGFSQLLKNAAIPDEDKLEAIDAIHESGVSLLELINDVLDLSKLEARKMEIVPEFNDMRSFLSNIHKTFIPVSKTKGLPLKFTVRSSVPKMVLFDRKRLRQIVVNILGNAFKFTKTGEVKFVAGFQPSGNGSGELFIQITDTGPGLSEENLNELFLPFKQHHSRDTEGTGLGLVISQRIATEMGGRIAVKSELGKGTTFEVFIPEMKYHTEPGGDSSGGTPKDAKKQEKLKEKRCTALLLDDVEMNLKILEAMLNRFNVRSVLCSNTTMAMNFLKEETPDIIFTDLWMPGMNGYEFAKLLAETPETAGIPIVVVTADIQIADFKKESFSDFLLKPISMGVLKETMEKNLNIKL